MTCWPPAPACGLPATTSAATPHAAASRATPGSASCLIHSQGRHPIPRTGGTIMLQGDHAHWRRKIGVRSALIAASTVGALCLPAAPASAATGPVSPTPVAGTPTLVATGTTEEIRQLADCGGIMYAVGTFTQISGWNGSSTQTFTRNNAFSFSDTPPYTVTSWDPDVSGTVDTIAFNGSDCSTAYLGGHFTTVGGAAAKNIAAVSTITGALATGFKDNASGEVNTLVV